MVEALEFIEPIASPFAEISQYSVSIPLDNIANDRSSACPDVRPGISVLDGMAIAELVVDTDSSLLNSDAIERKKRSIAVEDVRLQGVLESEPVGVQGSIAKKMEDASHGIDVREAHRTDVEVVERRADLVGERVGVESTSNATASFDDLERDAEVQEDESSVQAAGTCVSPIRPTSPTKQEKDEVTGS